MSLLVVGLVVSAGLIGHRIWGGQRAAPDAADSSRRGWAGLLEFALGRLVLAGMLAHLCLEMIHLAYTSSQGAALRLPFEALTSDDVYIFCTPLLAACVIYANCMVASLIGKMSGHASACMGRAG